MTLSDSFGGRFESWLHCWQMLASNLGEVKDHPRGGFREL